MLIRYVLNELTRNLKRMLGARDDLLSINQMAVAGANVVLGAGNFGSTSWIASSRRSSSFGEHLLPGRTVAPFSLFRKCLGGSGLEGEIAVIPARGGRTRSEVEFGHAAVHGCQLRCQGRTLESFKCAAASDQYGDKCRSAPA